MVKELLAKNQMQDKDVAEKLGMSPAYLCRIKKGTVALPPRYFKKASRVFKVPMDTLVELRVQEFRQKLMKEIQHY